MKLVQRVKFGMAIDVVPWWRGTAWVDCSRLEYVLLPIPLNLLARWARALWHYTAGMNPTWFERRQQQAFRRGREYEYEFRKKYGRGGGRIPK